MLRKFVIVAVLVVIVLGTIFKGRGGTIQFSPTSFERRTCTEYQIPIVGMQIYQSDWQYDTPPILQFFKDRNYINVNPKAEKKWITTCHWSMQWNDGHSQFHKRFFWNGKQLLAASRNNLPLADVVWPQVIKFITVGNRTGMQVSIQLLDRVDWKETPKTFSDYYTKNWDIIYQDIVKVANKDDE